MVASRTNDTGLTLDIGHNNNTNHTTDEGTDKRTPDEWLLPSVITTWVVALLLISLNTAVIVCIVRCKKKSRLYFILLHMAIADLLIGITDTVIYGIEKTNGYIEFDIIGGYLVFIQSSVLCAMQRGFSNTCQLASNFILCAASLDRALVVAKPMLNFRRGNHLQKCTIAVCWIMALAVSIPMFINYRTENRIGREDKLACITDNETFAMITYYLFVVTVLVPIVFIVICYIILITAVYRRGSIQIKTADQNGRKVSTALQVFNNRLPRSKVRSIKLMCGIVTSFVLSWLPFYSLIIANIHGFKHPAMHLLPILYYCNGVANPIIFFVFHRGGANSSSRATISNSPRSLSLMRNNCDHLSQHNSSMMRNLST